MEGVYGSIYTVQNGPSKVLESCGAARRRVETVGDIKHHTCEGAFLVVSHHRHFSSGLNNVQHVLYDSESCLDHSLSVRHSCHSIFGSKR